MNLEELDLMSEAFDTAHGFDVVNMGPPNGKAPNLYMIKNDNPEPVIVRFMALNNNGDEIRTLKPSDKNVLIELMTLSETGFARVLKGGFGGSDTLKSIVTIFDTVYKNLNLNVVESIMFRFNTKKMGGQSRTISRILERLNKTRGRGKFVVLSETAAYTKKYTYVIMHKKRVDISEIPGAKHIDKVYKKVATNVGEVYVNQKTGDKVSKADVVAQTIVGQVNKISAQEVVTKTKISRRAAMIAQYGDGAHGIPAGAKTEAWEEITANPPNVATTDSTPDDRGLLKKIDQKMKFHIEKADNYEYLKDNLKQLSDDEMLSPVVVGKVLKATLEATTSNIYDKLKEIVQYLDGLEVSQKRTVVMKSAEAIREAIKDSYQFTEFLDADARESIGKAKLNAVSAYCRHDYEFINDYLIGKSDDDSSKKLVNDIDYIFENHGIKLDKSTLLYRGMNINNEVLEKTFKSKVFYFRNYVSTSLAPMIFLGSFTDSSAPIADPAYTTDGETITSVISKSNAVNSMMSTVSVGMVISGAYKTKAIIPADLSPYEDECEVILPRGTAVRIEKAITANVGNNKILAECTVIDPSTLSESEVVYDGDALIETGEIKPLARFRFSEVTDAIATANASMIEANSLQVLADVFADTYVPTKFTQA